MGPALRIGLIAVAALVVLWVAFVAALTVSGRGAQARGLAGFVPDCAVLFKRLLGDPRVPRGRKFALALLAAYLAMPFDLVPDFIPVAGQLDDAIIVALVLRSVLRAAGEAPIREHWPGSPQSLELIVRAAVTGDRARDRP